MPVWWLQASRLLDCSLQGYKEPQEWTVLTLFNTLWTYDHTRVRKKWMQLSPKIKTLFKVDANKSKDQNIIFFQSNVRGVFKNNTSVHGH
jgi:hypothetical protein